MRTRIVEELRGAPDGLDVKELAGRLGLHVNSVRWHLGALDLAGAVVSAPQRSSGRGRPRLIYRLAPAGLEGTRDEYRLLATILTGTVADTGGSAAAEASGRAWGRYLVSCPQPIVRQSRDEATAAVVAVLAEQGFAPEAVGDEIRIRRCPFHDLAEAQPEVVCAVHKGLIDGGFAALGSEVRVSALDVFVEPDLCVARLSPASSPTTRPLPAVPVHHRVERLARARLEVGADRVCDRDQGDLRDLVVRDPEDLRRLPLVHEVEGRPHAAETA
jgi:predicted ArsR family transcriptional regulator